MEDNNDHHHPHHNDTTHHNKNDSGEDEDQQQADGRDNNNNSNNSNASDDNHDRRDNSENEMFRSFDSDKVRSRVAAVLAERTTAWEQTGILMNQPKSPLTAAAPAPAPAPTTPTTTPLPHDTSTTTDLPLLMLATSLSSSSSISSSQQQNNLVWRLVEATLKRSSSRQYNQQQQKSNSTATMEQELLELVCRAFQPIQSFNQMNQDTMPSEGNDDDDNATKVSVVTVVTEETIQDFVMALSAITRQAPIVADESKHDQETNGDDNHNNAGRMFLLRGLVHLQSSVRQIQTELLQQQQRHPTNGDTPVESFDEVMERLIQELGNPILLVNTSPNANSTANPDNNSRLALTKPVEPPPTPAPKFEMHEGDESEEEESEGEESEGEESEGEESEGDDKEDKEKDMLRSSPPPTNTTSAETVEWLAVAEHWIWQPLEQGFGGIVPDYLLNRSHDDDEEQASSSLSVDEEYDTTTDEVNVPTQQQGRQPPNQSLSSMCSSSTTTIPKKDNQETSQRQTIIPTPLPQPQERPILPSCSHDASKDYNEGRMVSLTTEEDEEFESEEGVEHSRSGLDRYIFNEDGDDLSTIKSGHMSDNDDDDLIGYSWKDSCQHQRDDNATTTAALHCDDHHELHEKPQPQMVQSQYSCHRVVLDVDELLDSRYSMPHTDNEDDNNEYNHRDGQAPIRVSSEQRNSLYAKGHEDRPSCHNQGAQTHVVESDHHFDNGTKKPSLMFLEMEPDLTYRSDLATTKTPPQDSLDCTKSSDNIMSTNNKNIQDEDQEPSGCGYLPFQDVEIEEFVTMLPKKITSSLSGLGLSPPLLEVLVFQKKENKKQEIAGSVNKGHPIIRATSNVKVFNGEKTSGKLPRRGKEDKMNSQTLDDSTEIVCDHVEHTLDELNSTLERSAPCSILPNDRHDITTITTTATATPAAVASKEGGFHEITASTILPQDLQDITTITTIATVTPTAVVSNNTRFHEVSTSNNATSSSSEPAPPPPLLEVLVVQKKENKKHDLVGPINNGNLVIPARPRRGKRDKMNSQALDDSTEMAWDHVEHTLDEMNSALELSASHTIAPQDQDITTITTTATATAAIASNDGKLHAVAASNTLSNLSDNAKAKISGKTRIDHVTGSETLENPNIIPRPREMFHTSPRAVRAVGATFAAVHGSKKTTRMVKGTSLPCHRATHDVQNATNLPNPQRVLENGVTRLNAVSSHKMMKDSVAVVATMTEKPTAAEPSNLRLPLKQPLENDIAKPELQASVRNRKEMKPNQSIQIHSQDTSTWEVSALTLDETVSARYRNDLNSSFPSIKSSGIFWRVDKTVAGYQKRLNSSFTSFKSSSAFSGVDEIVAVCAGCSNQLNSSFTSKSSREPFTADETATTCDRNCNQLNSTITTIKSCHEPCRVDETVATCAEYGDQLKSSLTSIQSSLAFCSDYKIAKTLACLANDSQLDAKLNESQESSRNGIEFSFDDLIGELMAEQHSPNLGSTESSWNGTEFSFDDLIGELLAEQQLSNTTTNCTTHASNSSATKSSKLRTRLLLARWYARRARDGGLTCSVVPQRSDGGLTCRSPSSHYLIDHQPTRVADDHDDHPHGSEKLILKTVPAVNAPSQNEPQTRKKSRRRKTRITITPNATSKLANDSPAKPSVPEQAPTAPPKEQRDISTFPHEIWESPKNIDKDEILEMSYTISNTENEMLSKSYNFQESDENVTLTKDNQESLEPTKLSNATASLYYVPASINGMADSFFQLSLSAIKADSRKWIPWLEENNPTNEIYSPSSFPEMAEFSASGIQADEVFARIMAEPSRFFSKFFKMCHGKQREPIQFNQNVTSPGDVENLSFNVELETKISETGLIQVIGVVGQTPHCNNNTNQDFITTPPDLFRLDSSNHSSIVFESDFHGSGEDNAEFYLFADDDDNELFESPTKQQDKLSQTESTAGESNSPNVSGLRGKGTLGKLPPDYVDPDVSSVDAASGFDIFEDLGTWAFEENPDEEKHLGSNRHGKLEKVVSDVPQESKKLDCYLEKQRDGSESTKDEEQMTWKTPRFMYEI